MKIFIVKNNIIIYLCSQQKMLQVSNVEKMF